MQTVNSKPTLRLRLYGDESLQDKDLETRAVNSQTGLSEDLAEKVKQSIKVFCYEPEQDITRKILKWTLKKLDPSYSGDEPPQSPTMTKEEASTILSHIDMIRVERYETVERVLYLVAKPVDKEDDLFQLNVEEVLEW